MLRQICAAGLLLVSAYLTTIRVIHIQGDMLVCTTMSVTVTVTTAMAVPVTTTHVGAA